MSNYVAYHVHTMDSLLDSCTNYKEYINKAVELGQKAICFTEHGNMYHWYKKYEYCKEKGVKFLYGIECYMTETHEEKIRDNYHVILIAKNHDGFVELNRLVSETTKESHRYYKPRISFDEFLSLSDNVIKISACLASPIFQFPRRIIKEENNASARKEKFYRVLKHYDYYEIQYHYGEQIEYNKVLFELSKQNNIPLIAGTDTHSISEYKADCRIMLKYGKTDGDWGDGENSFDLTYKTYDELVKAFKDQDALPEAVYFEAIENTNKMANSCWDFDIDCSVKYPILYEGQDETQIMIDRIMKMYHEKIDAGIIDGNNSEYMDNIKEEIRVFKKINMMGFMLFMSELMCFARSEGLFTSPCRGSVGGSTVAYITDIIDVDPVRMHTIFSRFANEYREEVGDIDVDFYEDDRPKVYNYIFDRFGLSKCAYILTVGTLADKAAIDTIGKAFRIKAQKEGTQTQYTLEKIKEIKSEWDINQAATRKKYPDLFWYYDGLVGCTVSQSMHPAGVVVSPINIIDNYGVFYNTENQQILPIDMDEVHEIGLVKYDILGLKNVGIISKTCEYAGVDLPKSYKIDWSDQNVFENMMKSPVGIFQFESDYAFSTIKTFYTNIKESGLPFTIDDMSIANACIRPSGDSYRNDLISLKKHKNPSELIDDLLANTHGYLCIKEDQLISTTNGLKQIKDIKPGDYVYTMNGTHKVKNTYYNGKKNTCVIKTPVSSIECTPDHKILTDHGWMAAIDIINNKSEVCLAHRYNSDQTRQNNNDDEMRLLGWFLGDGILKQSKTSKNHVEFVNADKDVINAFTDIIKRTYKESLDVTVKNNKSRVNKLDLFYCRVTWKGKQHRKIDKPVVSMLKKYGMFDKDAHEKTIPQQLFTASTSNILNFLGAYTDTDCHICNASGVPLLHYRTCSKRLAEDLQELYRIIGVGASITDDKDGFQIVVRNAKRTIKMLKPYSVLLSKRYITDDELKEERDYSSGDVPINNIKQLLKEYNVSISSVQKKTRITLYSVKHYTSVSSYIKICNYFNIPINEIYTNDNIRYYKITDTAFNDEESNVYDLEIETDHNFVMAGGIIAHNCMQEQVIAFLQQICGLSGGAADNVRRAIGRKQIDRLEAALPEILEGYCSKSDKPRDIAEQEAKEFLQVIEDSSSYMFGYNHSTGYSMLGYLCAYYRYYYPIEFCTAFLNCSKTEEDINNGTALAKSMGIKIENPKLGSGGSNWGFDKSTNTIYKGLKSIKNLGKNCGDTIDKINTENFDSFIDFFFANRLTDNPIKTSDIKILIKAGYFSRLGSEKKMFRCIDVINAWKGQKWEGRKTIKKAEADEIGVDITKYATNKTPKGNISEKQFYIKDWIGLVKEICNQIDDEEYGAAQIITYQYEALGQCDLIFPDMEWRYVLVTNIDTKYSPKFTGYCLNNGKLEDFKIHKRIPYRSKEVKTSWNELQLQEGDIIYIKKHKAEPRRQMINGEWEDVPGTKEFWLKDYSLVYRDIDLTK